MALASGAYKSLSYVAETVRGTRPASPTMKELRYTEGGLNLTKNMLESEEVNPYRQTGFLRHGFNQVGGSFNVELAMEAYDDWLAAALGGEWVEDVLKVGKVLQGFTVEDGHSDVQLYQEFNGVAVNGLTISIAPEAIVTGAFELIGMKGHPMSNSSLGAAEPAPTREPFAAFEGELLEGSTPLAVVTSLELALTNNRTTEPVVGSKFSPDIFEGVCQVTGTLSAFFESEMLLNKFINETESRLVVTLLDIGGDDSMTFTLPRIKYTGGERSTARTGNVSVSMPFTALFDPTLETTLMIERSIS